MIMWNPWHGCHKKSEGCRNCYMFQFDKDKGINSNLVKKTAQFNLPIKKNKRGEYKIEDGESLNVCLTSDFFIEEADSWRQEVWKMILQRQNVNFVLFTKRPERIKDNIPLEIYNNNNNIILAVTIENQVRAEERLPYLMKLPFKHISLLVSPILEKVSIEKFLNSEKFEKVYVSGENYKNARLCDFSWIEDLYLQCKNQSVDFEFFHTGYNFKRDGKIYKIPYSKGKEQARKAEDYLHKKYNC